MTLVGFIDSICVISVVVEIVLIRQGTIAGSQISTFTEQLKHDETVVIINAVITSIGCTRVRIR
jgi:hypothetical protein